MQVRWPDGSFLAAGDLVAGRAVILERLANVYHLTFANLGRAYVDGKVEAARSGLAGQISQVSSEVAGFADPGEMTTAGLPLLPYRNGRAPFMQMPDGIYFRASQKLREELGSGLSAPAGGWAAESVGGELQFTAPAGPGGLVDRFRLVSGVWRPTKRKGIVLIGNGQSQSGIHQSGGEPPVWVKSPVPHHVLMLNDGGVNRLGGLRGWMGSVPTRNATALVPAEVNGVQDIASVVGATLAYLLPVPPVVACRTVGRGGQRLVGIAPGEGVFKDSTGAIMQQHVNFVHDSNLMVSLMEAEGYAVEEITVLWDHAEADGLAGVSAADYTAQFSEFKADFEGKVSRPVRWLVTQPVSGEGPLADNDWPTRLALRDLAGDRVHQIVAKYDLPIGNDPGGDPDWVHTGYVGRVMLGEYYAHALAEVLQGRGWIIPKVSAATASGNNVVVEFSSGLPIELGEGELWAIPARPYGCELTGTAAVIQSVRKSGVRRITISCNASPAGGKLRIGYSARNVAHTYERFPVCVTTLRDAWEKPSRWIGGAVLRRWVWGGEYQL